MTSSVYPITRAASYWQYGRCKAVRLILTSALTLAVGACERVAAPYVRDHLSLPAASGQEATDKRTEQNCEEIYAEIFRLFPHTYSSAPRNFVDDDRNAAFLVTGLMFEPLFLGLGYTAATNFLAEQHVTLAERELDVLRRESAKRGCWLR